MTNLPSHKYQAFYFSSLLSFTSLIVPEQIDGRGTVFSHTKVLFVVSSLSNAFVTDRSEVGKKKDEKH